MVNHQEHIAILNVYSLATKLSLCKEKKFLKLKRQIDKYTVIVRDINSLLSTIDRKTREKISSDIKELSNSINRI